MSDLLQRIKLGTAATKLTMWPGTDRPILMKILSQQDLQEAEFATERLFASEKITVNLVTSDEYESERATQTLYRCLRDPEKSAEAICPTLADFRRILTRTEKQVLIDEYLTFEKDNSPRPGNMTDDEFDKVLTEVKKNPAQTMLDSYSTATQKKLITCLVADLSSALSDSFSTSKRSTKQ
jgi:hypothetical protein